MKNIIFIKKFKLINENNVKITQCSGKLKKEFWVAK